MLEGRQESGETPLLPSVRQWLDWKMTEVLPKAGGTGDQDPEFMRDFRIILGLEAKFEKVGRAKAEMQQQMKSGQLKGKAKI
jgi:hypothetical protein